ncbi:MAG: hypothetical protein LUM44_11880 [Pyrinomonadaceae bacterium]|nr:hypothetical protein [Pyrinomonadaceae bacterium]
MLKIKNYISAHKILAVMIAVLMLFSVTFAANSFLKKSKNACVFSEKTFYFSNASRTTVIGYTGYLCDGTFVKSGKRSAFTDTLYCDCNEGTE